MDDPACASCTPDADGPGAPPTVSPDLDGDSLCRNQQVFVLGDNFDIEGTCAGFGDTQSLVEAATAKGLYLTIDADAPTGDQSLTITTADGSVKSAGKVTILENRVPVPVSLSPTSGPVGTTVKVTGEDLGDITYVQLSGTASGLNEPAITNVTAKSFDMTITNNNPFPVGAGKLKLGLFKSTACGNGVPVADLEFTIVVP
jgi:hypothetical protein